MYTPRGSAARRRVSLSRFALKENVPLRPPRSRYALAAFSQEGIQLYIITIYYLLRLHFNVDFIFGKSKILENFQKIPIGNFPKNFRTRAGIPK